MRSFPHTAVLLVLVGAPLAGCTPGGAGASVVCSQPGDIDCSEDVPGSGSKSDQWDYVNSPERFARNLIYRYDDLPKEGASAQKPWASTYWPTYQDSTNVRWQGSEERSALEKYDAAFNDWTPVEAFDALRPMRFCGDDHDKAYYEQLGPAATWMTKNRGNARMRDGRDNDDDGEKDECGDDFDGIETWWGLCHAWVPAAILEPEPPAAVTREGVTFEVSDLTALLITAYDRSNSMFLGNRCNTKEVKRDPITGRITEDACRDTNAGAFHVVAANMLGLRKQAFAEDRTYDYEVWNQPVVRFEVTSAREVSETDAIRLVGLANADGGAAPTAYSLNPDAETFIEVRAELDYITESDASRHPTTEHLERYTETDEYHYVLELDRDRKIIGGEWLSAGHPDFLWLPVGAASGSNPHVDLDTVRGMVRESLGGGAGADGGILDDDGGAPDPACAGAYRDERGRCRRANGWFAPAACCAA